MKIDSIKNGIVIDHIQAGLGMQLYNLLGLGNLDCSVALIKNAASSKLGKKDIIKIDGDVSISFDVIGFIDPDGTVEYYQRRQTCSKAVHYRARKDCQCC